VYCGTLLLQQAVLLVRLPVQVSGGSSVLSMKELVAKTDFRSQLSADYCISIAIMHNHKVISTGWCFMVPDRSCAYCTYWQEGVCSECYVFGCCVSRSWSDTARCLAAEYHVVFEPAIPFFKNIFCCRRSLGKLRKRRWPKWWMRRKMGKNFPVWLTVSSVTCFGLQKNSCGS
jgi:hypothetical protein